MTDTYSEHWKDQIFRANMLLDEGKSEEDAAIILSVEFVSPSYQTMKFIVRDVILTRGRSSDWPE